MPLLQLTLVVSLLGLCACTQQERLSPIPNPNTIVIGQLKSTIEAGRIANLNSIEVITHFANTQRLNNAWSSLQFIHGPCTISLQFFAGNASVGYFALSNNQQFITSSSSGPMSRKPTAQETAAFIELLPKEALPTPFLHGQCRLS